MLDFAARTFGGVVAPTTAAPATTSRKDLPKALSWINVGYPIEVANADGTTRQVFIGVPVGIPLDTMQAIEIKARGEMGQVQAAQNDLMYQLQEFAAGREPGDATILAGLSVQLRRVNAPVVAPKADDSNPFAAKLAFG